MTPAEMLKAVNDALMYVNPLLGTLMQVGTTIVHDVKAKGENVDAFQVEEQRFARLVDTGIGEDDAWRKRHGVAPK